MPPPEGRRRREREQNRRARGEDCRGRREYRGTEEGAPREQETRRRGSYQGAKGSGGHREPEDLHRQADRRGRSEE